MNSHQGGLSIKGFKINRDIIIYSLIALLIFLAAYSSDVYFRRKTIQDLIEKEYNQKKVHINELEIELAFRKALYDLKDEDEQTKEELFNLLKNNYKNYKPNKFIQKRIKELQSNPNSAFKQKIEKFNILLISKKETDLVYKVLKTPPNDNAINHSYKDLNSHKVTSEKCDLINFYDCQDMRFSNPEDGDISDLKKAIDKLDVDENPNNLLHAVWFYTDEKQFTYSDLEVIKKVIEMFETKKAKIYIIFKKEKNESKIGYGIIKAIKDEFQNITIISNLKDEKPDFGEEENEKFYEKLIKRSILANTTEVINESIMHSTLGNIINNFNIYAHSINSTGKTLKPSFNLFIDKLANYFQVSAHNVAKADKIMDFYYKKILFETYKELAANLTKVIIDEIKNNLDYNSAYNTVFKNIQREEELYENISLKIFGKFKEDMINAIIAVIAEKSDAFEDIIFKEIKSKMIDYRSEIYQKKIDCLHNLNYDF